ncbi:MAG TPA: VWA domain-containing protein [Solirubrobacterales bacterium]|nr:VWA domain-containing protein [Solirubrobacterales bacterium]
MPPQAEVPEASAWLTDAVIALGRALRAEGIPTTVDQELALSRALASIDIGDREQVRWAARACFLRGPHEGPAFERVFDRFWKGQRLSGPPGPRAEHGETDPRLPGPQHGGESLPQFRLEGRSGHLLDGGASRAAQEIPTAGAQEPGQGRRHGVLAAYSPEEIATEMRRLAYEPAELDAVRALADALRRAHPERLSRRLRPSQRRGRLDLRRTMRRALRTDGEAIRPAWSAASVRPRRLVLFTDVSGSMERCSRVLLASLRAAVAAGIKAEAFVFATGLTRLTATLDDRDVKRALERARASVGDWSGGTRIGAALANFNRSWGRRGIARGAIVIIFSDGWDRGDPELLRREVRRLQLQSRRLIWVNPRPADIDMQPLAVGMRAAMPYVDDFIPGHDPRAIHGLAELVRGLGGARPARRQRPVSSVPAVRI